MATWRAKCWLGSSVGYQELEVQSNTLSGAKEQFERIYGAKQIIGLREVRSNNSKSSLGDVDGTVTLIAVLIGIWLLVEYWWIVVPIAVILGLLVWYGSRC
jgi:formate-dependent nitrite reductase membrane component NrfD